MRRAFVSGLIAAALSAGGAHAADRVEGPWAPRHADVFDTLHDNAWQLPTADGQAELYVTEIGHGPLVVVLHGGAGADFNYLVNAVRPAADRYRFVLYDQRGSALSPVPDAMVGKLSLDVMVQDLETLRIALGQDKLILLGHSFGSLLALSYYQAHADHVAGLVLTGSFPAFTPGGFAATMKAARARTKQLMERPRVAAVLRAEGLDGDIAGMTPKQRQARSRIVGFGDFDLVHVERWRQLQGGGVFYNARVDDAVGDSLPVTLDFRPIIATHPAPITIVQGDADYIDPGAQSWRGVADVQVVRDASHEAWIDNPAQFEAGLEHGLRRASQRR